MAYRTHRIETFSRKPLFGRRQYYFRIVSNDNGETVAQSEGVNNRVDRDRTVSNLSIGRYMEVVAVEK